MEHLDLRVMDQALAWSGQGQDLWLCTVMSTFGSSPREPGSWLVASAEGEYVGSLSGGCVEEDFIARLRDGEFQNRVSRILYGAGEGADNPQVRLPCGGVLEVLIERLAPGEKTRAHLERLRDALTGGQPCVREVDVSDGALQLRDDDGLGARVEQPAGDNKVHLRVGPVARLVIAGMSPVSEACAAFAHTLGYQVIVCDPREEELSKFQVPGVEVRPVLPSLYLAREGCHAATAIVALTHDPRIDDLALMEAVNTPAFYIGVMGSLRTSQQRRERLIRSGGMTEGDLARIHMPIGLNLGSKTPAEIALAVMADIVRVRRGRNREEL